MRRSTANNDAEFADSLRAIHELGRSRRKVSSGSSAEVCTDVIGSTHELFRKCPEQHAVKIDSERFRTLQNVQVSVQIIWCSSDPSMEMEFCSVNVVKRG